jgi:hypothetical protein
MTVHANHPLGFALFVKLPGHPAIGGTEYAPVNEKPSQVRRSVHKPPGRFFNLILLTDGVCDTTKEKSSKRGPTLFSKEFFSLFRIFKSLVYNV